MNIYKVINEKNSTVVEYYLDYDKALQSLKDMTRCFDEDFYLEIESIEDDVRENLH